MKRLKYILFLPVMVFLFTSCEDMLSVDSSRYVTDDDHNLASANDSVSSVLGILTGLQNIAERYVILGEVRADLLDVTEITPANVRQLSNFTVDSANEYADPRDYYDIINNCNYFISRTSTSGHPLKSENALVRAIRSWVYMQIVCHWGEAYYITEPMLTIEDTEKEYPVYDLSQMIDVLIADLEPYVDVQYPNYGTVYDFESSQLFIPVKVMLGDLYLWRGSSVSDYEKAAAYYADYIHEHTPELTEAEKELYTAPVIKWVSEKFERYSDNWYLVTWASSLNEELVTVAQMATSTANGKISELSIQYNRFGASSVINDLWDNQIYALYKEESDRLYMISGDLRKEGNIYNRYYGSQSNYDYLYKLMSATHIMLYRTGMLYLRYAEALNRAGKPNTAFAVLKYGLNNHTLENYVPADEWNGVSYISLFTDDKYDTMIGIHSRGCGDSDYNDTYTIGYGETLSTPQDSILWVENAICDELALETSFEGNRFQDLMRIALRRDDNSFLSQRIAGKHGGNAADIESLLSDRKNWFLPMP